MGPGQLKVNRECKQDFPVGDQFAPRRSLVLRESTSHLVSDLNPEHFRQG